MIQFDKDTQGGGGNQETLSRGCTRMYGRCKVAPRASRF